MVPPCLGLHRLVETKCSLQYHGAVKSAHLSKAQVLFFNIKSTDSKKEGILNLGSISSLYFNKKYLTASNLKVCDMFVHRPTASKEAIAVLSSVDMPHLLRKSILSLIALIINRDLRTLTLTLIEKKARKIACVVISLI